MVAVLTRPVIENPDILIQATPALTADSHAVVSLLDQARGENLTLAGAGGNVTLAPSLSQVLGRICGYLAQGMSVTLVPFHSELTAQAAANLLGISRTRLIQLIDRGDIPARREGTHRRLQLQDVLRFRELRAARHMDAEAGVDDMVAGTPSGQAELAEAQRRGALSHIT